MRFLLLLLLLLLTAPAWAWFEEVHELIAEIAWPDLRPEVRQRIEDIMSTHPDPTARTFTTGCAWPDAVKKKERPDTFGWHFVNLPWSPDGTATRPAAQPNAQTIIPWLEQEIREGRSLPENLAYLGHLVGDVHQPLHAINAYSAAFPQGDRGGGSVRLANGMNLHQYWDGVAELEVPAERARLATRLRTAYPRTSYPEVANQALSAWIAESHQAASTVAYAWPGDPVTTRAVGLRRVVLAGYRLADLLNTLFSPG